MQCRMCKSSNLDLILDLGFCPLGNRFLSTNQLQEPEVYYPLQLYVCNDCSLVQLGYVPPPDIIYNKEYAYEAGVTKRRREHHQKMAQSICDKFSVPKNSFVVDIGSNVGVLLQAFKDLDMRVTGVDPSDNVAEIARKSGINTVTGFFAPVISEKIMSEQGKAKVITATNVFAHLQDYADFMKGIDVLLEDDGIFVFQVHYFVDLVEKLQYDMIFHEHILYETLKPLVRFFESMGMDLYDVERHDIDGGVIRCFVCRKGAQPISNNVSELLRKEEETGINDKTTLYRFAERVKKHRDDLTDLLYGLKKNGKRIIAVSMPAKGVALFNYCKIDDRVIDYVTERSSLKIGKFTPGSHIAVKPDEMLLKDKPDYAILLAWNFEKEIIANNQEYLKSGGKFIVPIPSPRIVDGSS